MHALDLGIVPLGKWVHIKLSLKFVSVEKDCAFV